MNAPWSVETRENHAWWYYTSAVLAGAFVPGVAIVLVLVK